MTAGCVATGSIQQPRKVSGVSIGSSYPDIHAYIEGKIEYQDMSPDAQKAYMRDQRQIEVLRILTASSKITGDHMIEYLRLESVGDIKAALQQDMRIPESEKPLLIQKVNSTVSRYDLSVPQEVDHVYVILQKPGPLVDGSSELVALESRSDFMQRFETHRNIARQKSMKLVITAANAAESEWLHGKISFRGNYLRPALYRDPGTLHKNFPGSEVPLD